MRNPYPISIVKSEKQRPGKKMVTAGEEKETSQKDLWFLFERLSRN